MKFAGFCLALLLLLGAAVRADELHLKDGTKITGTIVGFQGNSFRVKTSYGFALVERSSVVSITLAGSASPPAPEKPARTAAEAKDEKNPDARKPAAEASADKNAGAPHSETVAPRPRNPENNSPAEKALAKDFAPRVPDAAVTPAAPNSQPVANHAAAQANPTSNAAPAAAPEPPPMREEVLDRLYVNETYGFQIYKPPEWELIQGARAALPGAIAALGTSDQTTYLIIGSESTGDTLTAHVTMTNDRLAASFDNFRPTPLRQTLISGLPACEYQFEGMANNQLWSGTVALIRRGENIFTIFGVTTASSDLVQIQQNVIARTIASLQFTKP